MIRLVDWKIVKEFFIAEQKKLSVNYYGYKIMKNSKELQNFIKKRRG